jgi:hypothetical protein|tara:strand:+ start:32 stop:250 length:219 start_codon:yes stop_codon:yes gene_type:complete
MKKLNGHWYRDARQPYGISTYTNPLFPSFTVQTNDVFAVDEVDKWEVMEGNVYHTAFPRIVDAFEFVEARNA